MTQAAPQLEVIAPEETGIERSRSRRSARWKARAAVGVLVVLAAAFFLYLLVPIAALLLHAPPSAIWEQMHQPDVLAALRLSMVTTAISTVLAVVFGLPAAIVLARGNFFGHRFLDTLATLPTVLPPTVAGLALLLAYGRTGLIGKHLAVLGITIPFTTPAVIMAQFFVAAPFFVNTARAGLEQLHGRYETAAYTLRATPLQAFRYVVLPLTSPVLLTAIGLAWARALGEFGATITFAGNFPGKTQTLPIAVYIASVSNLDKSIAVAVILLAVSFAVLTILGFARARLAKKWSM